MKLIFSVFIFIFIFSSCWAFDNGYESDNSDEVVVGNNTNDQILANVPFSLCILDTPKIPKDLCPDISLKLGGTLYNKYVTPSSGLDNKNQAWFYDIAKDQLDDVYTNYFFNQWNWEIPTTGQYQKMIDLGLISLQSGQAVWAKNTVGEIQRFSYKTFLAATGQKNASLPRLVTSDFPSTGTGDFYEERSFSLYTWKNAAAEIFWYVRYKDRNGNIVAPSSNVIKNGGSYAYPLGSSVHEYKACTASRCSDWGTADFNGSYNGRCFSAHGSLLNPWVAKLKFVNSLKEC